MRFYGILKPLIEHTELKMDQTSDGMIYQLSTAARPISHVVCQLASVDGSTWPTSGVAKLKVSNDRISWYDLVLPQSYSAFGFGTNMPIDVRGVLWMKIYMDTAGSSTVYALPIVTAYMTEV